MADKYPNISPYAYCAWNPIIVKDPNGSDTINVNLDKGTIERIIADGDHNILYLKNGETIDSDLIKRNKCSFTTLSYDITYLEGTQESSCHNEHLLVSDVNIGEKIFNKIATLGSSVEWDYYSMKVGYGDLSSSGEKDKMIHNSNQYTAESVKFWDHYHPTNSSDGCYPSYSDQDHARELKGIRCTIFFDGRSMDFNSYVPSHKNGYIAISKYLQIWNRFAK
jgi:hypothetical protein